LASQGGITSWNQTKLDAYRAVMDNFQQFDNTAGFFVGNEVLNVGEEKF
jgi:1,3-beta-glucanosyltransferase GAS1